MKTISIIIPVLNEQILINRALSSIFCCFNKTPVEVIVVDGDRLGSTLNCIGDFPVKKIISQSMGRGNQMNEGARIASGDVYLFLHADTYLPETALRDMRQIADDERLAGGAFDLAIDESGIEFRLIEKAASIRSRITRLPYGDQAVFIKKLWFEKLGGFLPLPLMEDVDLMRRLKKIDGKIRFCSEKVETSGRRWKREGLIRCTLRNWLVLGLYLSGVSPHSLKRLYP